jgi:hypothetical protein
MNKCLFFIANTKAQPASLKKHLRINSVEYEFNESAFILFLSFDICSISSQIFYPFNVKNNSIF